VFTARSERGNKWLEFKRGYSRAFMQHIAVHREQGDDVSEEDERLIGHYYVLALAVSDDKAAAELYEALPDRIRQRIHDPGKPPFSRLRNEVTPARRSLGPPDAEA
jgi:hypothetical protein